MSSRPAWNGKIVPNVSVTATWVQHRQYNLYNGVTNNSTANNLAANPSFNGTGITVGRATSSYSSTLITTTGTAPLQYLDVSPTGVSTVKTLYTYGTAVSCGGVACAAGTTASEIVNNPSSSPDTFNSFEVGVTKKYSKKWTGYASFWDTKSHRWIDPQCNGTTAIVGSPNDCAFPLDLTWNWEARVNLTYRLPWGFNLYTYWRAQSGIPGARYDAVSSNTNTAQLGLTPTTANSANGPLAQGTTYIAQEAYGSERGPLIEVWNFKAAKVFKIKDRYSIEANYQLYNILNSNAAVATTYLSGSTYGTASSIVAPRVYRFGGVFSF